MRRTSAFASSLTPSGGRTVSNLSSSGRRFIARGDFGFHHRWRGGGGGTTAAVAVTIVATTAAATIATAAGLSIVDGADPVVPRPSAPSKEANERRWRRSKDSPCGGRNDRDERRSDERFSFARILRPPPMPPPMAILRADVASTATCDAVSTSAENVAGAADDDDRGDDGDFFYLLTDPLPRSLSETHAIFGPLTGPGLIERYSVYRRAYRRRARRIDHRTESLGELAVADLRFGDRLNGHDGVVHGGIVSLLFDDAMGWGYDVMMGYFIPLKPSAETDRDGRPSEHHDKGDESFPIAVTANLEVNFRSPLRAGADAVMRIYHVKTAGRKIYFSARLESPDGETLYAEGTSLYVVLKKKE